jgi:hypothetical protein
MFSESRITLTRPLSVFSQPPLAVTPPSPQTRVGRVFLVDGLLSRLKRELEGAFLPTPAQRTLSH